MATEVKYMSPEEKKAKFESILLSTGRHGIEELIEWLNTTDFYTAPASSKYHGAYACGLLDHSLDVYRRLVAEVRAERKMVADMLAGNPSDEYRAYAQKISEIRTDSLPIVALLHDICKISYYESSTKNVKITDPEKVRAREEAGMYVKQENGQKFYWETVPSYVINDTFPYGHGEKSVYLAMKFIPLYDEEALAIRAHMGEYGGDHVDGKIFGMCPLALLLHNADEKANFLDQNIYSN